VGLLSYGCLPGISLIRKNRSSVHAYPLNVRYIPAILKGAARRVASAPKLKVYRV